MTILFLHGAGNPNQRQGSFRFLQRLAISSTMKVRAPQLPNPDNPDAAAWTNAIAKEIQALDEASTILTHSLGGSCTLAALTSIEPKPEIKSLIMVATPYWGKDPDWSVPSFVLPTGYSEALASIKSIQFVYSKDDEVVPASHMYFYLDDLPRARAHLLDGVNHAFVDGSIERVDALLAEEI